MPSALHQPWHAFEYFDSREILLRLGKIERGLDSRSIPDRVIQLRTRGLRPFNERRQGALFCYGISCLIGRPIAYAPVEDEDFDCVARWADDDVMHYTPIQLKELPPNDLNPGASLEAELAKLAKYVSSPQLCVAYYLNRQFHFDPSTLRIPKLPIGELWMFGATSPDKSRWRIWGDLLASPASTEYVYPA